MFQTSDRRRQLGSAGGAAKGAPTVAPLAAVAPTTGGVFSTKAETGNPPKVSSSTALSASGTLEHKNATTRACPLTRTSSQQVLPERNRSNGKLFDFSYPLDQPERCTSGLILVLRGGCETDQVILLILLPTLLPTIAKAGQHKAASRSLTGRAPRGLLKVLRNLLSLRVVSRSDRFIMRRAKELGMQVQAAIPRCFRLLDGNPVSVRPRILANARDLPRDLNVGFVGLNAELVIGYFGGHDRLGKLADNRQLIAEVAVESLEPFRQSHNRIALRVCRYLSVIDVLHVGGFDERMIEILVGGIERMIDLERSTRLRQIAGDIHVTREFSG